jgi:hypothetical protein
MRGARRTRFVVSTPSASQSIAVAAGIGTFQRLFPRYVPKQGLCVALQPVVRERRGVTGRGGGGNGASLSNATLLAPTTRSTGADPPPPLHLAQQKHRIINVGFII